MFRNYYIDLGGSQNGTLFCTGGTWNRDGIFFASGGSTSLPPSFGGAMLAVTFDPVPFDSRSWVTDFGVWDLRSQSFLLARRSRNQPVRRQHDGRLRRAS
jgi:hypothetical protein